VAVELVLAAVQLEVIELLVMDLHHYKVMLLFYALDQIIRLPLAAVVLAEVNPTLTLLLDLMDLEMEIHLFLL
tara:strand:+ start:845 stop:1063 length:219 start_codon:yes stop_codon:yes gene_type:complete